jgi:hypothetical protein
MALSVSKHKVVSGDYNKHSCRRPFLDTWFFWFLLYCSYSIYKIPGVLCSTSVARMMTDRIQPSHRRLGRTLSTGEDVDVRSSSSNAIRTYHQTNNVNAMTINSVTVERIKASLQEEELKLSMQPLGNTVGWDQHDSIVITTKQLALQQQLQCTRTDSYDKNNQSMNMTAMSDWTITDLNAPEYFNQYTTISDFLKGPALDHIDTLTEAACAFRYVPYIKHFPHMYVHRFMFVSCSFNGSINLCVSLMIPSLS